jgi:hypothetical protein
MHDATTITPMPRLDCPKWCEVDHEQRWAHHVALLSVRHELPHTDGTIGVLEPVTDPAKLAEIWGEDLHAVPLIRIGFVDDERLILELQTMDSDPAPTLYLNAEGSLTAEQAEQVAQAMLDGASRLRALSHG